MTRVEKLLENHKPSEWVEIWHRNLLQLFAISPRMIIAIAPRMMTFALYKLGLSFECLLSKQYFFERKD